MRLKKGSEEMTTADKVIKTKVGVLELGKQLGQRIEGLPDHGLQPG
jgi:hypothetical protein